MAAPDPFIGRDILNGEFRILEKIGTGGMGSVYKANQTAMNRPVAVKILHPKLTNRKDLVSRFRREAKAMSHLSHPNTVRVLLYGELEDGSLYIVMEYLEGKNLNQTVRSEGPMPVERALPILIQVCEALEEAHRAGQPFVEQRWLGGMLTNFKTIKTSIRRLKEMEQTIEGGGLERMSKKEALTFQREVDKLNKSIGGIKEMNALPDALFVIDVGYHKIAVAEAQKLGIPVIGVVDTNHSPEGIAYVIPGNDDSSRAVRLYARGVADAVLEGKAQALQGVVNAATGEFVEVNEEEHAA